MLPIDIRKTVLHVETIRHEGGPVPPKPLLVGTIATVIRNPYARQWIDDPTPLMEAMKPLGRDMARQLLDALGGDPDAIEAYGKGSMVGDNGEIEHAALWHAPGGHAMRELLGTKGFVPSGKMMATVGTRLMIPLTCVDTVWVRSHYGIAEMSIHDAPRPNELVLVQAMATGGRIHARIGGMTAEQALAAEAAGNL